MEPNPSDRAGGAHAATPAQPAAHASGPLSPAGWIASCLGIVLCVGIADFVTGTEVELILFYLAPIGFGTWYVSLSGGAALAVVSVGVSVVSDGLFRMSAGEARVPVGLVVWNGGIHFGTALALVLVLAALRERLEGEELLARTDALTRIANRRAFFESARLEIERARRNGRPLALAYVDCDDFKDVNDRLGHAQGDALLRTTAQALRGATRAVDAVARLGGDEFGVLLPETSAEEAEALLARVHDVLLAAMAWHGWKVGFSVGAAVFLAPPDSVDEMMARADELMYAAKREAKGSIRIGVFEGGRPPGRAAAPR